MPSATDVAGAIKLGIAVAFGVDVDVVSVSVLGGSVATVLPIVEGDFTVSVLEDLGLRRTGAVAAVWWLAPSSSDSDSSSDSESSSSWAGRT